MSSPDSSSPPIWLPTLCVALAAMQVWIFRWGVILPDSVVQYGQVLSGRYEDWHPPVTAWLWRWIGGGRFGSAPFLILDCLAAWTGLGLFALAVRRGASIGWALAVLAVGLTPIVFGEFGAILKDSLLAAAMLFGAGLVALASRGGHPLGWRSALPALLAFALAAGTRFNAFLAAAPLAALLLPAIGRAGPVRHAVAIAAAGIGLATIATIANGVILAPVREQPFLSLVSFDLAGMSAQTGHNLIPSVSDAAARAMIARCYSPAHYNLKDDPSCTLEDGLKVYLARSQTSGSAQWLRTIAQHPIAYARHRLAHFNLNQRWLWRDVPVDAVYVMSADNPYGLSYRPGWAAKRIGDAAEALARTPFGRPATWLAVALGLLIVAGRLPSAAIVRALALSALLYGGGYLVVSVATDLRYNLWTMLAAMLGLVIALAEARRSALPGRWLAMALVPVAIVVAGELFVG